ncbi:MAG: cobalt ECF transporter T component CbiQ [Candidatus Brocadiae bacterium]|nr:cobalt ECF transporter T component CbiQ [Candidatus Brocadiia bacterium]
MHVPFDPHLLRSAGPLQALDARCKVLGFAALIVCSVSVPRERWQPAAAFLAAAALLLLLARLPWGPLLKRLLLLLPILAAVALVVPLSKAWAGADRVALWPDGPLVPRPALLVAWNVSAKALTGTVLALVLAGTTGAPALLDAFSRLRFPRHLLLIASFIHRYTATLVEELERMRRARDARGWRGRWLWHTPVLGRMLGTLFLRSYERGERVWLAMLARGWNGRFYSSPPRPLAPHDLAFVGWMLAAGLALRFAWGL